MSRCVGGAATAGALGVGDCVLDETGALGSPRGIGCGCARCDSNVAADAGGDTVEGGARSTVGSCRGAGGVTGSALRAASDENALRSGVGDGEVVASTLITAGAIGAVGVGRGDVGSAGRESDAGSLTVSVCAENPGRSASGAGFSV